MASFSRVSDLKPFKTMWKIKVKIIRLWKQYSTTGGLTIEMVVVDSNGVKIHASVKKDLVNRFDPVLSQGDSKILINFSVGHSFGSYRTTDHPYKISFLETTRVRNCELPIEVSGFDPASYRDILDGSLNADYLVDVIGQIVEVSPIEVLSINGKETNKIDDRLPIVLWGSFANEVMEAIQTRSDHAIICVIRFWKIKIWKDECSISNAYNVSEVQLNPPMSEVQDLLAVLPKEELTLAIVESKPLSVTSGVSEKDDFFIHTPRKTISQLCESRQVEKCIVMCTISAIDSDMGWYYLSCKVYAKKVLNVPNDVVDDEDDENPITFSYYCSKCKVSNPKLLPRYKLHLIVVDSTGTSKFLLFDNLAIQLIHQPCNELVGHNGDEIEEPDAIPLPLMNLVGKTYLFKVGIERENFLYKKDTYKVTKIITSRDIITEFEQNSSPKIPCLTYGEDNSIVSHAPEGSLLVSTESHGEGETTDLTPAKRRGTPIVNLEEAFDQSSGIHTTITARIKKEKTDKSG
ncbi:replication protein A 70 kDa DNA-binding subunit C-like [Raphanus sativus]|uniref:Replication protein A 70 kDa DNA-binding subunit C-like n=1 Tax=Raphanus sativus TaxID=3726 RepID=A0A9W3CRF6_RAPSA|nr:replication protein A 70 kDa DNA-binding subunit C-like [Raphanus sativus]